LKLSHLDQSLLAAGQSTPIWMNRFWPLGEPTTKIDTLPLLLASPFVEHEAESLLGLSAVCQLQRVALFVIRDSAKLIDRASSTAATMKARLLLPPMNIHRDA